MCEDRLGSPSFNSTHERHPAYLLTGTNGVVASEEIRCSTIGIDGEHTFCFLRRVKSRQNNCNRAKHAPCR
jgi:hypothetical protein